MTFGILLSLAALSQNPAPGAANVPAPILNALEQRGEHYRSVIVEWDEVETVPRGSASLFFGKPGGPVLPAQSVQLRVKHRLILDGDRGHYHYSGDAYDRNQNKVVKVLFDSARGDKKNVECRYFPDEGPGSSSLGYIFESKVLSAVDKHLFLPLLMAVRPTDPTLNIDLPLLDRVAPSAATFAGEPCDVIKYVKQDDYNNELWFTRRGHYLVRFVSYQKRTPLETETISYGPETDGWRAPKSWELTLRFNDQLIKSVSATVTSFQGSPPIDESEFDFDFPPGVTVSDLNLEFKQRGVYIAEEHGRLRPISPARAPGPAATVNTAAPVPGRARGWPLFAIGSLALAAVVLIAVFAGRAFWRRRAQKPEERPSP
jgi:hypothetical protein